MSKNDVKFSKVLLIFISFLLMDTPKQKEYIIISKCFMKRKLKEKNLKFMDFLVLSFHLFYSELLITHSQIIKIFPIFIYFHFIWCIFLRFSSWFNKDVNVTELFELLMGHSNEFHLSYWIFGRKFIWHWRKFVEDYDVELWKSKLSK